ncbi:heat-inducible transcription repressor HrcA [Striga asiatica]|uniref:Heat-inducible transcription repressor HrcA n=1 Tax=Striga asiatica TaxID=4170 RepID=A0A5A7P809_STRAF|nr:heat-inducible transcription repressor HrcA [Striga asiatica]
MPLTEFEIACSSFSSYLNAGLKDLTCVSAARLIKQKPFRPLMRFRFECGELSDRRKCALAKLSASIREHHDFSTARKRFRVLTGRRLRMFSMTSNGSGDCSGRTTFMAAGVITYLFGDPTDRRLQLLFRDLVSRWRTHFDLHGNRQIVHHW